MAKRLGIIPHRYAQPAFFGLREHPGLFDIQEDHAGSLAVKLRENELDGAFLSPIDYAKEYAMYRIVPDVGVISEGASGSAVVLFKEHLRGIRTLAVDARSTSEIVLAHLVFAEKYDTIPQFIPVAHSLEQALDKADAVLLIGDAALSVQKKNTLDLVDEWQDITGMPFVHGVWAARDHALSTSEMNTLIECAEKGSSGLDGFSRSAPNGYFEKFQYSLTEEAISSLSEFYRLAYYHGIIQDMPDVKFHSSGEKQ